MESFLAKNLMYSGYKPRITESVAGKEGNAYPLGALAVGTLVNSVEKFPDKINFPATDDDVFVVQAGTCAEIVRHYGDHVIIRVSQLISKNLPDTNQVLKLTSRYTDHCFKI